MVVKSVIKNIRNHIIYSLLNNASKQAINLPVFPFIQVKD